MDYTIVHKEIPGFDGVVVPVSISKLTREARNRSFSTITDCCGEVVKQKKFCVGCGSEVSEEQKRKGIKVGKKMLTVEAQTLKDIKARLDSDVITISEYRAKSEIPEKYYSDMIMAAEPGKKAGKQYGEFAKLLETCGKVAIGQMIFNSRPYPVMIGCEGGVVTIRGMLYADEVKEMPAPQIVPDINAQRVELLSKVLNKQTFPAYDHSKFVNTRAEEEDALIMTASEAKGALPPDAQKKVYKSASEEAELKKLRELAGE